MSASHATRGEPHAGTQEERPSGMGHDARRRRTATSGGRISGFGSVLLVGVSPLGTLGADRGGADGPVRSQSEVHRRNDPLRRVTVVEELFHDLYRHGWAAQCPATHEESL